LQALGCECRDLGIVADDPEALRAALQRAAAGSDLILTTGGVSVGEEDHVRAQVEALGEMKVWKLAIKPGKPLAYGRVGQTPLLGLPGNPASVLVTFCLLARPYLLRLAGVTDVKPLQLTAVADFDWPRAGKRQEYLRVLVQVDDQGVTRARLAGGQSSGVLSTAARSNALAVIPVGASFESGAPVRVLPLSDLLH
jgi:molybdopterin molybdotransferase